MSSYSFSVGENPKGSTLSPFRCAEPTERIIRGSEKGVATGSWLACAGVWALSGFSYWHSHITFTGPRVSPVSYFFLLFPLAALLLTLRALWETARLKRFGDPVLELASAPIPPGESVMGRINLGAVGAQAPEFKLALACIHRTVVQGAKGDSIRETVLWSGEQKTTLLPGGILNVSMAVPADQPESHNNVGPEAILWRLTVTAPFRGMAFQEKYLVPVYKKGTV